MQETEIFYNLIVLLKDLKNKLDDFQEMEERQERVKKAMEIGNFINNNIHLFKNPLINETRNTILEKIKQISNETADEEINLKEKMIDLIIKLDN